MPVCQSAVLAIAAIACVAMPARAQQVPSFAITPFVGIGTEGATPVSAAIQVPVTSSLSVETDAGYRRGEGRIHAPSANASVLYSPFRAGRFTPYGAVGVGIARYGEATPFLTAPGAALQIGTAARTGASVNVGGGIKTRLTDRVDVRTDLRWFQRSGGQHADPFRVAVGIGMNFGTR